MNIIESNEKYDLSKMIPADVNVYLVSNKDVNICTDDLTANVEFKTTELNARAIFQSDTYARLKLKFPDLSIEKVAMDKITDDGLGGAIIEKIYFKSNQNSAKVEAQVEALTKKLAEMEAKQNSVAEPELPVPKLNTDESVEETKPMSRTSKARNKEE